MAKLVRANKETAAKDDVEEYVVPNEVQDVEDELSKMQDKCTSMLGDLREAIRQQKAAVQVHRVALKDSMKTGRSAGYKESLDLRLRELASMEDMQTSLKEILSSIKNRKS